MKLKKLLALIVSLSTTLCLQTPLFAKSSENQDQSIAERSVELSSVMPAYTNVPDFSHLEYWTSPANSGDPGQCNWYATGALNQMYGNLPGVDINSWDSSHNFNNLGGGADFVNGLLSRWGPGNAYGNPVYFVPANTPEDGSVFSSRYSNGGGHVGVVMDADYGLFPLTFEGNFDWQSNSWDQAIKNDWVLEMTPSITMADAIANPAGLAKEVQNIWKNNGLKVERVQTEYSDESLYNSRIFLDNALQAWPADGDKVYPDQNFAYFKKPIDVTGMSLLRRVLYYGVDGPEDKISSMIDALARPKYMNELVQAACNQGDRSHNCYSYMTNTYGWDLKQEQDYIFEHFWPIITDPALPEPPASYRVYCLESDDLSLRQLMWKNCEYLADQMVQWNPTSRLVFGVPNMNGSADLQIRWMKGDPIWGGEVMPLPDAFQATARLLINGVESGFSTAIDKDHPTAHYENLPIFNPETLRPNRFTMIEETEPGKWYFPGAMIVLPKAGLDFQFSRDTQTSQSGTPSITLVYGVYDTGASFEDVPGDAWYLPYVLSAAYSGIATGKSETRFDPDGSCTRAEAVTFLYRIAGQPDIGGIGNPFKDVKESDYFYKPVLWAVANNLTTGKTADTFDPGAACTRAEFVTFLYRYAKSPVNSLNINLFSDVKDSDYFANSVTWAYNTRITTGTNPKTFSPYKNVTRSEAVTFLARYKLSSW